MFRRHIAICNPHSIFDPAGLIMQASTGETRGGAPGVVLVMLVGQLLLVQPLFRPVRPEGTERNLAELYTLRHNHQCRR
jgi:hypothetical protein